MEGDTGPLADQPLVEGLSGHGYHSQRRYKRLLVTFAIIFLLLVAGAFIAAYFHLRKDTEGTVSDNEPVYVQSSLEAIVRNATEMYKPGGKVQLAPALRQKTIATLGQLGVTASSISPLAANNTNTASLIYLRGSNTSIIDNTDTELPFYQESNFRYLSWYAKAGAQLLVDIATGDCTLFVMEEGVDYAIWNGVSQTAADVEKLYGCKTYYNEQFAEVLRGLKPKTVYTLPDGVYEGMGTYGEKVNSTVLLPALEQARAFKTPEEIELMKIAAKVSAEAQSNAISETHCGWYEYETAGLFAYITDVYGLTYQSYEPIVGSGPRSAILHYQSNDAQIPADSIVLTDAGAMFMGYTTDITRTWPCGARFTEDQLVVYKIVLAAQLAAIDRFHVGVAWSNVTGTATTTLLQGLATAGFVTGSVDDLQAAGVHKLFMPHGLSHFVGLDVHDSNFGLADVPPGDPDRLPIPGPLAPGMLLTVEPGVYFIPALLNPAFKNPKYQKYLNVDKIKTFFSMGGVRIEDVVLVTESGPEILTSDVPKAPTEIMALKTNGGSR